MNVWLRGTRAWMRASDGSLSSASHCIVKLQVTCLACVGFGMLVLVAGG